MERTCCAPGCKTGCKGNTALSAGNLTFHTFPRAEEQLKHWIDAIQRSDWKPSLTSLICSLHFTASDFVEESEDFNTHLHSESKKILKKRSLKPTAVPSIFPNALVRVSKSSPKPCLKPRSSATTSCNSLPYQQPAEKRVEKTGQLFSKNDEINCFSELKAKMKGELLPYGADMLFLEEKALFFFSDTKDNGAPFISGSVVVDKFLTFSLWEGEDQLPLKDVSDITPLGKISSSGDVLNLITYLKNDLEAKEIQVRHKLAAAVELLSEVISEEGQPPELIGKLQFVVEQLQLATTPPKQRRYSTSFLKTCALWQNTSPKLYRQLLNQDILSLPSYSRLRRVMGGSSVKPGLPSSTNNGTLQSDENEVMDSSTDSDMETV